MLRDHSGKLHSLLQVTDVVVSGLLFAALLLQPDMRVPAEPFPWPRVVLLGLVASVVWPIAFGRLGLYASQRFQDMTHVFLRLWGVGGVAILTEAGAAFVLRAPVVPHFPLLLGLLQLAVLASLRLVLFGALRLARRSGRNTRNVIIIGSGPRAAYVQNVIEQHPAWGLNILGFMDDGSPPGGPCVTPQLVFKLVDMPELLHDQVVDEVIVACPRSMLASILVVVDACAAAGVPITLLSDIFGDYLPAPRVQRFGSMPALNFAPVHHSAVKLAVKRSFDVLGASAGLLVAAPVLGLAALAIRLTSPGPILFRQIRCGLNGRHFLMLKLRTMYTDADARKRELAHMNEMDGPVFKIRNDPRITPVGRVLRRLSIDELPQLWNVLRGDMSLVGPRPPVPIEVAEYQTFERRRLSMRPGLTCLWQVSGRNSIGFEDWVRLDLEYIDTWSLWNDCKILLWTLPAVATGEGAS
jgi:exopolysaccharide biosynthesis polyprenyl glycosylphosphotransferase